MAPAWIAQPGEANEEAHLTVPTFFGKGEERGMQKRREPFACRCQAEDCGGSFLMVGATGFEPATPCSQGKCATKLRYAPTAKLYR